LSDGLLISSVELLILDRLLVCVVELFIDGSFILFYHRFIHQRSFSRFPEISSLVGLPYKRLDQCFLRDYGVAGTSLDMAFSSRAVFVLGLLSALALCHASSNGNTVTERMLHGFNDVTITADNLRIATQKINIANAPRQGLSIADGITRIVAKIAHGTEKMNTVTSGPLPDTDAELVVQSLATFVQVHQALLNVVIRKNRLLTFVPSMQPIRVSESLASLQAAIETFAFKLTAFIPTQSLAAHKEFHSLSTTLKQAQHTYSQPTLALADPDPVTVKILEGFDNVTTQSNNLRIAVETITIFNAGERGFIIAEGFTSIIAKIAEGTSRVHSVSTGPLPNDDAKLVVQALTTFVRVHQGLLLVVIGKHGLLTLAPFFEPIRLALVDLEAAIDTLAFDLIGLIPTQKSAAGNQFAALKGTLTAAIFIFSRPPELLSTRFTL
jgi:hypothetical protein